MNTFVDAKLAREIERERAPVEWNKESLYDRDTDARAVELAGGLAFSGGGVYRVAALGLPEPLTEQQLMEIENIYADRKVPFEVQLCPFAHPSVPEMVSKRGYRILRFENVMLHRGLDVEGLVASFSVVVLGRYRCVVVPPGSARQWELENGGFQLAYTGVVLARGAL